jgi:hypothetical protein
MWKLLMLLGVHDLHYLHHLKGIKKGSYIYAT